MNKIKNFAFKLSNVVSIMLINVKMTFKHYEHDKLHAPEIELKKVKVYIKKHAHVN